MSHRSSIGGIFPPSSNVALTVGHIWGRRHFCASGPAFIGINSVKFDTNTADEELVSP